MKLLVGLTRYRSKLATPGANVAVLVVLLAIIMHYLFSPAYGAELGNRSLSLSNNQASASATYAVNFSLPGSSTVGSVKIQFCSNDAIPDDPCVAPAGLDLTTATLTSQAGMTGFTISNSSDANTMILTRPPAAAAPGLATYFFDPVTNPSSPGSYFVRLQTFATGDATGPASDYGGIAFVIANQLSISATVPPYLLFCAAVTIANQNCANAVGDYIDFGELSTTQTSTATSQMLVGTNAEQGYAISMDGTTMASGNNIINPLATGDVSRPGTAQFGFNLRANATPRGGNDVAGPGLAVALPTYNQPNTYRFLPGDTVVSNSTADDVRVFTSQYIVNVPPQQAAGIYVSTVTYICLANF